jgi:hypothetical protein
MATKSKKKKESKKKLTRKEELEAYFEKRMDKTKKEAFESAMVRDDEFMSNLKEYNEIKEKEHEEFLENATMSQKIDLTQVYRVKGESGLFTISSEPNKSGIIGMRRFGGGETVKSLRVKDLENLSLLRFFFIPPNKTQEEMVGKKYALTLGQVLDNLEKAEKEGKKLSMEIAVPNYDEDEFKPYHFKSVIKYYTTLDLVLNQE